ncbi:hypothetical protein XBFFL1_1290008 [Xenorhabdus bovienii str. feltiae Florida]|nr:hypothetical protein XBFFL1_1290008 [Xenorhabdus bovienii str. feltiae Florida]
MLLLPPAPDKLPVFASFWLSGLSVPSYGYGSHGIELDDWMQAKTAHPLHPVSG